MKKKLKPTQSPDARETRASTRAVEMVRQYKKIDERIAPFLKRKEELKQRMAALLQTSGYTDDKGHLWVDLPEEVDGVRKLHYQKREPRSLDEDACMDFLKRKKLVGKCTEVVAQTVINEDAMWALVFDGKLNKDEVDALYTTSTSWAFYLK